MTPHVNYGETFTIQALIGHELAHIAAQRDVNVVIDGKEFSLITDYAQYAAGDNDSGFKYVAGSSDLLEELVTDNINGYMMNLYTIGPEYSDQANVAGNERREQGETILKALIQDRLGDPPGGFIPDTN